MKTSRLNAFTLIELLVVISIIAILAGIALPVFGEVQVRGAQTKALSNAKQVGTACKLFAMDYQGNFPIYTDPTAAAGSRQAATNANEALATLVPDYLPDKGVFTIPKSAYCKPAAGGAAGGAGGGGAGAGGVVTLNAGENEWAYVMNLSDTSSTALPLLADGFTGGASPDPAAEYGIDETQKGGVWKGKKAIVIRVDISGTVETLYKAGAISTVKLNDDSPKKNLFSSTDNPAMGGAGANAPKVFNPL